MGIFRSKEVISEVAATPPLSLSERFNAASALHGSALGVFEDIASQLSDAEAEFQSVIAEADEEITRLTMLRMTAAESATRARGSIVQVLDITRGFRNDA